MTPEEQRAISRQLNQMQGQVNSLRSEVNRLRQPKRITSDWEIMEHPQYTKAPKTEMQKRWAELNKSLWGRL